MAGKNKMTDKMQKKQNYLHKMEAFKSLWKSGVYKKGAEDLSLKKRVLRHQLLSKSDIDVLKLRA